MLIESHDHRFIFLSDIGDWKMTITEDHFIKRTRTSTFTFEAINDAPIDDSSGDNKPGPLVGLLVRNKFKGINEFAKSILGHFLQEYDISK